MARSAVVVDPPPRNRDRRPPPTLIKPVVKLLLEAATTAKALAKEDNEEGFHGMVEFAVAYKILTTDEVAEVGRVDRTTATRWMNGRNTPNSYAREAVLNKIAEVAQQRARQLQAAD